MGPIQKPPWRKTTDKGVKGYDGRVEPRVTGVLL